MKNSEYDRNSAVDYALKWALSRNPEYYDFQNIGGDCTNYISQCIYAGTDTMNFTKNTGWYYINLEKRAPAWTSVNFLYQFLTTNMGPGPFGEVTDLDNIELGDIIQLKTIQDYYHHSCIVTRKNNDKIFVCAHSYDVINKPLFSYNIKDLRPIHIEGYRNYE